MQIIGSIASDKNRVNEIVDIKSEKILPACEKIRRTVALSRVALGDFHGSSTDTTHTQIRFSRKATGCAASIGGRGRSIDGGETGLSRWDRLMIRYRSKLSEGKCREGKQKREIGPKSRWKG